VKLGQNIIHWGIFVLEELNIRTVLLNNKLRLFIDVVANIFYLFLPPTNGHKRWRSWLRHYATSRKVAGLIPDEVIGFFSGPNPSSRIWPSVDSVSKRNGTRKFPGGLKGGRRVTLTPLPSSVSPIV
jgi:hypothetical protein